MDKDAATPTRKQCPRCKQMLPIDAFYATKRGTNSWCRECERERSKLAYPESRKAAKRVGYRSKEIIL